MTSSLRPVHDAWFVSIERNAEECEDGDLNPTGNAKNRPFPPGLSPFDPPLFPKIATGAVSPAARPGMSPPGDVRACPPSVGFPTAAQTTREAPLRPLPARPFSAASLDRGDDRRRGDGERELAVELLRVETGLVHLERSLYDAVGERGEGEAGGGEAGDD